MDKPRETTQVFTGRWRVGEPLHPADDIEPPEGFRAGQWRLHSVTQDTRASSPFGADSILYTWVRTCWTV